MPDGLNAAIAKTMTRERDFAPGEIEWIEIIADYRCNNRCLGCYSVSSDGPSMDAGEILRTLREGRRRGARSLWLGGGEPTMRPDLFSIVKAAGKLGYERIKLQTNGMLLAYESFTARAAEAGVTEVCFGIRGKSARSHDSLAKTPGCHELMVKGIEECRRAGIRTEADLLVYRDNRQEIVEMVSRHAALGIERFHVWLFSTIDDSERSLDAQVPRIAEVVPEITRAMDLGLSEKGDFIVSLHTPPCTVPESHQGCLFLASALRLLIVNPGGHSFMLETSPIEGGMYLDRCVGCRLRPICGGVRADYVRIHGDAEFAPPR